MLGQSAAQTQGLLDTVMAETLGMSMHNAVTAQHNSQMVASAAVTAACARMIRGATPAPPAVTIQPPPPRVSTSQIAQSGLDAQAAIGSLLR